MKSLELFSEGCDKIEEYKRISVKGGMA